MKPDQRVRGAIALLRESFRNDGAEGESVHVVCDFIEEAFPEDAITELDLSPPVTAKLREISAEFTQAKNAIYSERNKCIALIARLAHQFGYRVGCLLDEEGTDGFIILVLIDLPSGQLSWHVHESERAWFEWMPEYTGQWDGHSTDEKYSRALAHAMTPIRVTTCPATGVEVDNREEWHCPECERASA